MLWLQSRDDGGDKFNYDESLIKHIKKWGSSPDLFDQPRKCGGQAGGGGGGKGGGQTGSGGGRGGGQIGGRGHEGGRHMVGGGQGDGRVQMGNGGGGHAIGTDAHPHPNIAVVHSINTPNRRQ
ncbi:hypothetical protein Tcan_16042 [Toxocara canis]|uniref:Uncharacterized protein n=1 Tax=Toxocara canis TaxID=6265 RepID=A0A0B2VMK0_TOXCA|nr:hypothetical protein Tcan_16042 [Toxocara canis]